MNRAEMAVAFGAGGFASGRLLGATGPRMESYNWKAKPISPCLGAHEAHPKTTLYWVVFQKLNGPCLRRHPAIVAARMTGARADVIFASPGGDNSTALNSN